MKSSRSETFRRRYRWLVASLVLLAACSRSPRSGEPRYPEGSAGKVLSRAIEAAGGWERWMALRDVTYISTLNLLDPFSNVTSESIGWFMAPLHGELRARMNSIGLDEEVQLGLDAHGIWMLREGKLNTQEDRLALARFNMVNTLFWFSLPFSLAEWPVTVTDLGELRDEKGGHWERLKAVFEPGNPRVPGEWFVLYFNGKTGLIDRVHAHINEPLLSHHVWMGEWNAYQSWNGLKKERRRDFYPADEDGKIVGNLVAKQLVESVRFNDGYALDFFDRPAGT